MVVALPSMNNPNNNEIRINLANALNILRNTINPQISLYDVLRFNRNNVSEFECDLVYLHLQIIFATPHELNMYLDNYCNRRGLYATNMFVNYPLLDIENRCNITPMDCAVIWNRDPQKVRVLYRWGADVYVPNVDGRYINDGNVVPYRNYLSRYTFRENIDANNYPPMRGLRNENEFYETINEINYISGERGHPNNWFMPARIVNDNDYQNRNRHPRVHNDNINNDIINNHYQ